MLVDFIRLYSQYGFASVVICMAVFFFGATIASGINCAIYRYPNVHRWLFGRSGCEGCGRALRWWELIPVISCILLRGRCHTCKFEFGYIHAALEAMLGMLTLCLYVCRLRFTDAEMLCIAGFVLSAYVLCARGLLKP